MTQEDPWDDSRATAEPSLPGGCSQGEAPLAPGFLPPVFC